MATTNQALNADMKILSNYGWNIEQADGNLFRVELDGSTTVYTAEQLHKAANLVKLTKVDQAAQLKRSVRIHGDVKSAFGKTSAEKYALGLVEAYKKGYDLPGFRGELESKSGKELHASIVALIPENKG